MNKLPIGIQSFSEIRTNGYLYVDKTKYIYELATKGKYYFLSRPRRFGKSLLISTIKELFSGNKDLFKGLWIENKWNWKQKLPIIHLSLNNIGYKELGLEQALHNSLDEIAQEFDITYKATVISQKFKELIKKLHQKGDVVILIDEYDKPIIDYLAESKRAQAFENQEIMKNLYSVIKDSDPYIEFLLITGVSKFNKVGIFSELNNPDDLTIDPSFSKAMGYTQTELLHHFSDEITLIANELNISETKLLQDIKKWYDGYTWDGKNHVYNPFSILSFFKKRQFQNFWFETGTPTFLTELMKEGFAYQFNEVEAGMMMSNSCNIQDLDIIPILFETGYLTIKNIDYTYPLYTLGYPNKEVEDSMLQYLSNVKKSH